MNDILLLLFDIRRGGDTLIAGYGKGGFKCFLGDPEVVHDAVTSLNTYFKTNID